MTIEKAIEEGIILDHHNLESPFYVIDVGFTNSEDENDETQFDVYNYTELKDLWRDFCEENGVRLNSVHYIAIVG